MDEQQFKARTKAFALKLIGLVEKLPRTQTAEVISRQLLRCGTSVGATYRVGVPRKVKGRCDCKATDRRRRRRRVDLLDGTPHRGAACKQAEIAGLLQQANEIIAMTVASIRTIQRNSNLAIMNRKSKID
ncbi:MAG TPA: four helix bundle protein [Candidatus Binatia bacterium]